MPSFFIRQGLEETLPTIKSNGTMYICNDTGRVFLDTKVDNILKRVQLSAQYAEKLRYFKNGETIEIELEDVATSTDINALRTDYTNKINALDIWTVTSPQNHYVPDEIPTEAINVKSEEGLAVVTGVGIDSAHHVVRLVSNTIENATEEKAGFMSPEDKSKLENLEGNLTTYADTLAAQAAQNLATVKQNLENKDAAIDEEIQSLENSVNSKDAAQTAALESAVDTLDTKIEKVKTDAASALSSTNTTLTNQITTLTNTVNTNNTNQTKALNDTKEDLEDQIATAQSAAVTSANTNLNTAKAELNSTISTLETKVNTNNTNQTNALNSAKTSLTDSINTEKTNREAKDAELTTAINTKLPKAGGTMTGKLTLQSNQYTDAYNAGALDLANSNIDGVNSIYFADAADNNAEGIHFYRDSTHSDTIWAAGGTLYFAPNRTIGSSGTDNIVLHSSNYTSYAPTKTGAGASGTWSINVTGNANTATYAEGAGAATTATTASGLKDSNNGATMTTAYSKAGLSTTDWVAAWNGQELRAIAPSILRSVMSVPTTTGSGASGTWGINITGNANTATSANAAATATSATTASNVAGIYDTNGGQRAPNAIGTNKVNFHMGNEAGNGYQDWIHMNCYSWSDVPYATMIGVTKAATPSAYIASGGNSSSLSAWTIYKLLDDHNYTSYVPTKTGSGASGTWGINITGSSTSCTGNSATASKLGTSTVGSSTQPIYLNGGTATACSYTLGKSVPSDAKFTDTTYSAATTSAAGLMSAADKVKLNGIATGANNYTYTLPNATSSTLGGVKVGSNISVSSGTISLTKANVTSALGYTPPTTDTTYNAATTSTAGLMSATDKSKLDGITASADSVSFSRSLTSGTKIGTITINGTETDLYCQTNTNTWNANSVNVAGYVSAPTSSNANKVWGTDASGNPGWITLVAGISFHSGTYNSSGSVPNQSNPLKLISLYGMPIAIFWSGSWSTTPSQPTNGNWGFATGIGVRSSTPGQWVLNCTGGSYMNQNSSSIFYSASTTMIATYDASEGTISLYHPAGFTSGNSDYFHCYGAQYSYLFIY